MNPTYRQPKTEQCLCLNCGFQSGAIVFKPTETDEGKKIYRCPDCGSEEVLDADTKERMNPV